MVQVSRLVISLIIYSLLLSLILIIKPSLMFNQNGEIKPAGLEKIKGQSVLSIAIVIPLIAIFSYFIASLIDMYHN